MKKKIISLLLCISLVFTSQLSLICVSAAQNTQTPLTKTGSTCFSPYTSFFRSLVGVDKPAKQCNAAFNGTFIQSWLCLWWDDATWQKEIEYMKQAGVEYLILQDAVSFSDESTAQVCYPSELDFFNGMEKYGDFIGDALRNCQGSGIKVFVGLAVFDDWWVKGGFSQEYESFCRKTAEMEEEIYNKYYEKYKDTFYGWYFSPEISNNPIFRFAIGRVTDGFNIVIDKAKELNPDLPMLLSPFYLDYASVFSLFDALPMWISFFKKAHLRDGDIFCPQDAVGAGWVRLKNVERVWQMYSSAISSCKADVKLWANCENMTIARQSTTIMSDSTLETEDATATVDRLVAQMEIASKYVENIIVFSYNHYYSPNTINPVYHQTYLDYLAEGSTEKTPPTAPSNVRISDGYLKWDRADDDIGIAYYIIYENDRAVARIEENTELCYPVSSGKEYCVYAVDGAGNYTASKTA